MQVLFVHCVIFLIMAAYCLLPFLISYHKFCDRVYAVCCGPVQVHVQVHVQCVCVCACEGVVTSPGHCTFRLLSTTAHMSSLLWACACADNNNNNNRFIKVMGTGVVSSHKES